MGCGPPPPCVRDRRCAPDPPVQPARPRPSPYPGFASLAGCAVCGIHDGSKRVSPELRTVCGTRMRILIAFRARFVPLTHRQLDRLGPVCRPQVAIRLPPAFGAESSRCKLRPPGPQRASHRVSHGPHRSIRAFHLICHGGKYIGPPGHGPQRGLAPFWVSFWAVCGLVWPCPDPRGALGPFRAGQWPKTTPSACGGSMRGC